MLWGDLYLDLHIALSFMNWERIKVSGKLCEEYWLTNVPGGEEIFLLQLEKMLCVVLCVCVCVCVHAIFCFLFVRV